ncbi:alpha/beta-hydrolase [Mycena belliarum]|uniref:carboxypeptidase C n=1 Tax=Mycena belliarum TaxID=1033014 RepID=A0AAD6UBH2_9AGAR|nr:alpha/beta-hydrolase [Mycena belliae]
MTKALHPLSAHGNQSICLVRQPPSWRSSVTLVSAVLLFSVLASVVFVAFPMPFTGVVSEPFYYTVTKPLRLCANSSTVSHSGYIGLKGDTEVDPKRSYFWYFEAEETPAYAPIILTIGGGPGTSGLNNAMMGQSACLVKEEGLVANPNRWTEKHNLIVLDHPIGVGYSYGTHINNSRAAAYDVYDFLQKFFVLFPQLSGNKFVISGGSYGGVYVPNIATVIHEQNQLLSRGKGRRGAVPIALDALILSNPFTNPEAHFRWLLQYRCMDHHVYNATDCMRLYAELPACLDSVAMALQHPSVANRVAAAKLCYERMNAPDTHGTVHEDIRRKCTPASDTPGACRPQVGWMNTVFNDAHVKRQLGVPASIKFTGLNKEVNAEFLAAGDLIQAHHLMYPPLLAAGIRLLHYIGMQDSNCPWPGIFSFLKLLETPFQDEFIAVEDRPWPTTDVGTVRAAGPGAGNMTMILLAEAGHFTVGDQPALAKRIVETWIANRAWFETD